MRDILIVIGNKKLLSPITFFSQWKVPVLQNNGLLILYLINTQQIM